MYKWHNVRYIQRQDYVKPQKSKASYKSRKIEFFNIALGIYIKVHHGKVCNKKTIPTYDQPPQPFSFSKKHVTQQSTYYHARQ